PASCDQVYASASPSGSKLAEPSRWTVAPAVTAWLAPALATGAWSSTGAPVTAPHASSSARPTFSVLALTLSRVKSRLVVVTTPARSTDSGVPPSGRAPTATLVPSENVRVAAVTRSARLGRSWSTTRDRATGRRQVRRSQLPAPPPCVAHSFE